MERTEVLQIEGDVPVVVGLASVFCLLSSCDEGGRIKVRSEK